MSRRTRGPGGKLHAGLAVLVALLAPLALAQFKPYYEHGQGVAPVYEGYELNADGSYTLYFGYMNENWEEQLFVPIGASNAFSPGCSPPSPLPE